MISLPDPFPKRIPGPSTPTPLILMLNYKMPVFHISM